MRRGRPVAPARLTVLGLAAFSLALAALPAAAPAQDAPELPWTAPALPQSGEDARLRIRSSVVRFVWRRRDPQLFHIQRAIVAIEAEAGEAVRRLETHRAAEPARTSLEVLDDAWWVVSHAELVGVPESVERPLRRAVSRRIAPLRCAAIHRYFEAVRLSGDTSSVRAVAVDHLDVHGRAVVAECVAR